MLGIDVKGFGTHGHSSDVRLAAEDGHGLSIYPV
jgi:hypothetical protein